MEKAHVVPNYTFVSTTGPTLDNVSAKAMRAHTTRANFARRRLRLVREYADQTKPTTHGTPIQNKEDSKQTDREALTPTKTPIVTYPSFGRDLHRTDAFFINFRA
jgi:hypothetical protein